MGSRREEFGADTQFLLVSFSEPDALRGYAEGRDLPFQILHDEGQEIYRLYGLDKGTRRNLWGFSSIRSYARIIAKDGFSDIHKPVDDWEQLGGDFVIAADGTLVYGHWSSGPGDRPDIGDLVDAVALVSLNEGT